MAYSNYASITIDSTKVSGTSNLTNFPILVSGTYDGTGGEPDIRTTANGGNVQNTDANGGASGSLTVPADFVFSPNTDGSTPYDFEIASYDATAGTIQAWVRIPTLTYDSDTTFYMVYGDSGVTTTQENVGGTWEANYKGVWHLENTMADSSGNSNTLTDSGTADRAGKIGRGRDHNSADAADGVYRENDADLDITVGATFELSCWFIVDNLPTANDKFNILGYSQDFNNTGWWGPINIGDGTGTYYGRIIGFLWDGSAKIVNWGAASADTWYYAVVKSDGTNFYIWVNGTATGTTAYGNINAIADSLQTNVTSGGTTEKLDGCVEEIRFATTMHTDDWTQTEYNNQNSPSTFYTMGNETAAGGGSTDISGLYLHTL